MDLWKIYVSSSTFRFRRRRRRRSRRWSRCCEILMVLLFLVCGGFLFCDCVKVICFYCGLSVFVFFRCLLVSVRSFVCIVIVM